MRKSIRVVIYVVIAAMISACSATPSPQPTPTQTLAPSTAAPTPALADTSPPTTLVTCADIDANWGNNWPAVLDTLDKLIAAGESCGDEPLLSKKYAVYFNYAASLENEDNLDAAIEQYQAALSIDPQRREALNALTQLEALPKPTPPTCLSDSPPLPDPAPAEAADPARFVAVEGDALRLAGKPFVVKGVNYYPRQAPWERFFDEADPAAMAEELDLISAAGFNTLRVFLWYKPLFTCQPEDAIPNESAFALVDALFGLAAERDLKLIVVLNDLPDLIFRPLYTDWPHYDAQTAYIARRYRNEPALLAWDVRNAPDLDYGNDDSRFQEEEVINWLAHVAALIRDHDPHHLITAGWEDDPTVTAPYVDILSFQHWDEVDLLQERIEAYSEEVNKPLLLATTGQHSWRESPDDPQSEESQAEYLASVVETAEAEGIAGWIIWTAFDFTPQPGQPVFRDLVFGLWRTDLSPKPVLEVLP